PADIPGASVDILPESIVSYLGDAALLREVLSRTPDVVGLSVYSWNVRRSLHLAAEIKKAIGCRVVCGGPEVTPDNRLVRSAAIDFLVYGEGEAVFRQLLQEEALWQKKAAAACADSLFRSSPSPYQVGLLEPEIEDLVLLETQRGCPFNCGYCSYGKARRRLTFKSEPLLLDAVNWAVGGGHSELYFLDPTLNTRPGIEGLLDKIKTANRPRSLALISEIRADRLDAALADRFAAAGFSWFEIGLQTTNPRALDLMNRATDPARFLAGARLLGERGISATIDLIAGLPGDDLPGFKRSVDFIVKNDLRQDVQVFPLAVLPGTDFRARSQTLGLTFEPEPPYPVIATTSFSEQNLLEAFDYAETRLEVNLYPMPALDISWRRSPPTGDRPGPDHYDSPGNRPGLSKLILNSVRPLSEIEKLAQNLTHPYQVFIGPDMTAAAFSGRALEILTAANPFTPLEVVFIEPREVPDTDRMLDAVRLNRPHFLDLEHRFLFAEPGNRCVLFTLLSRRPRPFFTGDMQRQVFWWDRLNLPEGQDLNELADFDGLLVDSPCSAASLKAWQNSFIARAAEVLHIGFADISLQRRWLLLTEPETYYPGAFGTP
ncbi:MAG: B12-binding domain-containing radical SAM protein, partial [Desulfobacterales bacterium]